MDTPELNIKNDGDDQDGGNTVLVDDVAGWARSEDKVKRMLKDFFSRCRLFNVRLNAAKFQFGKQIRFGGLILNKLGAVPDEHRMDCVKRYPRPTTKKQVTQFLGVATSLASFSSTLLQDCK